MAILALYVASKLNFMKVKNHMKSVLVLIMCMPFVSFAAGYGGAEGINKRGEIVRINGDLAEKIYVQTSRKDLEPKESFEVRDECPSLFATFEGKRQFSCRKDGKSPLAGTTYRVTTSKKYQPCSSPPHNDKSPGEIYVCIAGCDNPRAPKTFLVSPWECG